MRHFLLVIFLLCTPLMAKYIAVLETMSNKKLLTLQERQYLTDILRSYAVQVLPAEQNYTIMTRENINVMLPPGKTIEDCEGSCLAETGKNIAADYVAQARVSLFGQSLAISVELYETASSKLVSSFNGQGQNVNELLTIIHQNSVAFFKKIKDRSGGSYYPSAIMDDLFASSTVQQYIIEIVTNPAGAIPSIDGKAIPKCTSTPCTIQVDGGDHRFVVSKDLYLDSEKSVMIQANHQKVEIALTPNFGTLELQPRLHPNMGAPGQFNFKIDNKNVDASPQKLIAGPHSVHIEHPCYNPVDFKMNIQRGSKTVFDSILKPAMAGIDLSAELNGVPQARAVYANNKEIGTTPFKGKVPLCADITIGENREKVNVQLKWHEFVQYTHPLVEPVTDTLVQIPTPTPAVVVVQQPPKETEPKIQDTFIPTEKKTPTPKPKHVRWVPLGIFTATIIGGVVTTLVGDKMAKKSSEKEFTRKSEYEDLKSEVHHGQNIRNIGLGIAIIGAIGFSCNLVF